VELASNAGWPVGEVGLDPVSDQAIPPRIEQRDRVLHPLEE
jgi:hypothetical protein